MPIAMSDPSGHHPPLPAPPGRAAARLAFVALLLGAAASAADAQMPGIPVLQNAFANPGITAGAVYGGGGGTNAGGIAATWAPGTGWIQLTGGGGGARAGGETGFSGGARVAVSLGRFIGFLRRESVGVTAFVGGGLAKQSGATAVALPAGLGAGFRRALGATRVISAYVAPFYGRYELRGVHPDPGPSRLLRVSGGVDVALLRNVGLTVGAEGGQSADGAAPGPHGSLVGVGLSYAFR